MPTIVTRLGKGSPLTTAELDANLTNINAETVDNSSVFNLRPSLDIDLVGSKTVSPLLSFSRGSTGTYYDGKTAVKAEENLLKYSQEFDNIAWITQRASISANNTVAPDGTTTADLFVGDGTTNTHRILQDAVYTYGFNVDYVFSVYAKAGTNNFFQFDGSSDQNNFANFDLSAGTVGIVGSGATASIVSVGSGWYKCIIKFKPTKYGYPALYLITSATATRTEQNALATGVYLWGAQLEQRSSATAYTPTTSTPITNYIPQLLTAPTNTPRFDHDPVTGELKGLMVEESRTNLLPQSDQLQNTWTAESAGSVSFAGNVAIAPDGTLTATKITEGTTTDSHIGRYISLTTGVTGAVTWSIFIKAAGRRYLYIYDSYLGFNTYFDAVTGTLRSPLSGTFTVKDVGNGWWRLTASTTTATTYTNFRIYFNRNDTFQSNTFDSYAGDGVSGIYIWGAQLEAGSQATSYIPTPLTYTSRASTATYKGDDGYLKTAAINEARYERNALGGRQLLLEGAGSNILTRTERFDVSNWNSLNATVIPNTTVSPDGTITGDMLVTNGVAVTQRVGQTSPSTGQLCFSVYAKANTVRYIQLLNSTDGNIFANFDLQTGSVGTKGSSSTSSIVYVGGGWYRCALSATVSTGNFWYVYAVTSSSGGYGSSYSAAVASFYIWGAQLETGSVATSYMPSTETFTSRASTATYFNSSGVLTTAAIDTARTGYAYDASRNQWVSQGLILEPAATNLLTYSEQFDNAAWASAGSAGSSVTANAVAAPDGNITANKLIGTAIAGTHGRNRVYAASNSAYTFSVFLKAAELTKARIDFTDQTSGDAYVDFNLSTGRYFNIGFAGSWSSLSASITAVGNGWYRCTLTATKGAGTNLAPIVYLLDASGSVSFTGDGTSGIYVWGAQLETGSVATSYIPTTSAQVTRAADVYTSTAGSRAADVYSSSTVTRSADQLSINKTSNWFNSTNGTLSLSHDAASGQPLLGDGSSTIISSLGAGTVNIDYSNTQLSVVTQSGQSNNTTGIFNFDTDLYIGGNSTSKINNHIKYLKFYPNNVINSTPDGSGLLLDTGFALLQEDGSVIFQE